MNMLCKYALVPGLIALLAVATWGFAAAAAPAFLVSAVAVKVMVV